MKIYQTYTLSCPLSGEIKYVGQTCGRVKSRLSSHIKLPASMAMKEWISSLSKKRKKPVIDVVDTAMPEFKSLNEAYWICFFNEFGFNLLNSKRVATHYHSDIKREAMELYHKTLRKLTIEKLSKY